MAKKVLKAKKVAAKKKLKPVTKPVKDKGYRLIEEDFLPEPKPVKSPAIAKFNEAAMHTVFDTETTGLVTNRSIKLNRQPEVIEFFGSLVDLSSGKVAKQLHRIIQPTVEWPMTEFTIKQTKTKLSNDLLSDKPKFKEVSDEIKHFLESAPALIAHNISFDKDMIEIELERLAQTISWPKTCICTVEQTLHLRGHRLNLTRLHEFLFNEPFEGAHRAEDDVNALTRISVELYRRQLI